MTTAGASVPFLARLVPPLPAPGPPRPWRALVLACLGLAALSLLLPSQPTYDPWAWLIWGRDITQGDLVTDRGPSWKPLPVLFTTVFSLLGDDAAPKLWLIVARAGGLLALAMTYRLASRLGGRPAGVVAVACLALADLFLSFFARGNSEGLLVGLVLWAFERHLDGRPRDAFLLGAACALLRPEVWPFIAVYGLWLMLAERPRRGPSPWSLGSGAAVALLWFVPEYLGSGNLLRAASRALEPVPDSPAQAARPFLAVFENSSSALWPPAYAGAVIAVVLALMRVRRDPRAAVVLALAAVSTLLMLEVAVLAEIGFTGNLRYVALPSALVCVLAGVGLGVAGRARARAPRRGRGGGRRGRPARRGDPLRARTPCRACATSCATRRARWTGPPTCRPRSPRPAGGTRSCAAGRRGPAPSRRSSSPGTCGCTSARSGLRTVPPATLLALRGSELAREPGFRTLGGSRAGCRRRAEGAPSVAGRSAFGTPRVGVDSAPGQDVEWSIPGR